MLYFSLQMTLSEKDPSKFRLHSLSLTISPQGVSVRDLINRGYEVYRYLLRGLILIDLKQYSITWRILILPKGN